MKPIDNWADAARQLNEDTRNLTKALNGTFDALQEVLKDMNARLTALEVAAVAAADPGWAFNIGDRVTKPGPDYPIMEVTGRRYDAAGTRMYELDQWLYISDDIISEQEWERA